MAHDHPTWALGYADEVWWSRLAQPDQHGWVEPAGILKLQVLERPESDPDPKALACYGLLVRRKSLPSYLVYATAEDEVFHVLFAVDVRAEQARVLTAYRPDPEAWEADQKTRRRS